MHAAYAHATMVGNNFVQTLSADLTPKCQSLPDMSIPGLTMLGKIGYFCDVLSAANVTQ